MKKEFNNFQIAEYENIARAHFETVNQVSIFFRYYLIIMSVPSFIFIWSSEGGFSIDKLLTLPNLTEIIIKGILIVLPIAGLLMCLYLISLKLDAILYARTVNGIRKYFYDYSGIEEDARLNIKVLPTSVNWPKYFSWDGFLWVVVVFALINSAYLLAFCYITTETVLLPWHFVVCTLFFIIHIFAYWFLGHFKNKAYQKK